MTWAEFEEKEYEIAFAVELSYRGTRRATVFGCGQVLEKILGYDAVSDPDPDHVIWRLLGFPRPTGIKLVPTHWAYGARPSSAALPSAPVSLVLQYKRPEYLYGATAGQWRMWGTPYYRFTLTRHQQQTLARLERGLGGEALVRYASPAFWRRGELEAAAISATLLDQSGFVSPSVLTGHRVWTYTRSGRYGRPNPRGRRHEFPTLDELLGDFFRSIPSTSLEIVRHDSLEDHVRRVGTVARDREPSLRSLVDPWVKDLTDADIGLSPDQIELVGFYASTTSLLFSIGASWYVFGGSTTPVS